MPAKGTNLGVETKGKISKALAGRKFSQETIEKMRAAQIGRVRGPHSQETRDKISAAQRGRKKSPEAVEKNRLSHIGLPGLRKGAHHTEEAKQKIRAARARQLHPAFAAAGITNEMVAEAANREMRWCGGCKAFVFRKYFYTEKHRYCSHCVNLANKKYRGTRTEAENEEYRAKLSKYRIDNAELVRKNWLRSRYGVTPEWYDAKFAEQGGHCALCPAQVDERKLQEKAIVQKRNYLLVDHSHETGLARGLLCAKCNTALHRVEYVDDWAGKAIRYLARYSVAPQALAPQPLKV